MAYQAKTARVLITLEVERMKKLRSLPANQKEDDQQWINGRLSGLQIALQWIDQFAPI